MMQTMKQLLGLQGAIRSSKLSPIFIPILCFISFSHTQHLHPRQIADCADPAAITDPSCWDVLGVPAWLSQFAGPNSTCAASNLAHLDEANSSWGACFILTINQGAEGQMVAEGLASLNANITVNSLSRDALEMTPVGDRPRYLYGLSALSSIRGFFINWNDAVSSNATACESDVLAILAALDPSQQTSFAVDDLYQSLMLGLPFFLAYNGSGIPLGLSLGDISGLLLEMVNFAVMPHSNVSSPLNVTGMIQARSIRSLLPQLAIAEGSGVQYCLQSTVSNLDTFRNVTTDGAFASSMPWSIPQDPASVAQPFYTFLVSSILAQQNWTVLALVGIDVAALSQGSSGTLPGWVLSNCPTCTPPVDFGCTTYDGNSQCARWWYSEDLNSSFTLVQGSNPSHDPTNMISTIFQQGWTTGALLFENAAICNEPPSLNGILSTIPKVERPASPLTDYMDSWFWRLLGVAPLDGTASVDVVVGDDFNAYIELHPGPVSHPRKTLVNVSGGKIDFSCLSQLDLQVGWNWSAIVAGNFS
ncbi:MAG: hypothetical protein ASARMPRED_003559 [Alectoria sarmentosa]|nr:MAG: hypothetical protein ASARMPRED_003559 [Alectoria sarmentosa]